MVAVVDRGHDDELPAPAALCVPMRTPPDDAEVLVGLGKQAVGAEVGHRQPVGQGRPAVRQAVLLPGQHWVT